MVAHAAKRVMDVALSATLLVILAPMIGLAALAVLLTMGRPILFTQVRPGLHGRPFKLFKFRTMTNALSDGSCPSDRNRLTRLGRLLRSTSIDELPELWNVLRGDMSLVGPRPLLMQYLPYYTPEERKRHSVRPGLTGYAQVIGRNALEWNKRLEADSWYVRNQTLALDLWILYRTIVVTIMRSGVIVDPGAAMSNLDVERRDYLKIRNAQADEYATAGRLIQGQLDIESFAGTVVAAKRFPEFLSEVVSKQSEVRVVVREDAIVGTYQALESEATLHLNYIAVIDSEQGWGTAELLMQDLSRIAAGRAITLHVDSRNSRAVSFYSRLGYVIAGRIPMCNVIADGDLTISESRLVDPQAYARYGISYLELDGERVGIIDDRCLNVPIGASESTVRQCLKMSRGMVVRMTEECAQKVGVAAHQSSFVVMQMVLRQ